MKNHFPLVSVVITFLNEERFLSEAVESVLAQSYENWELVLVDDGSSDASRHIAQEYIQSHPGKIVYAEHERHLNKGLSASRNLGISLARGELVAFLDADDIWKSDKLENQIALMTANPKAAMLCETCEYWHNWQDEEKPNIIIQIGAPTGHQFDHSKLIHRDKVFNPPELAELLYPLGAGEAPSLSGIIIKKEVLKKHTGFEERFKGMYEDQAFLLKIYLNEAVYISSLCHHKYRQRKDSISQKALLDGEYHMARRDFLEWLEEHVDKYSIEHIKVHKLLKNALDKYRRPTLYSLKNKFLSLYANLKKKL